MEGRFLQARDVAGLRAEAIRAGEHGATAVFLDESPLGDPIVLAAGLSPVVLDLQLGARVALHPEGRHPALLARDITSLDLVCGGRSILCFAPPFTEPLAEAISLCRSLWLSGATVNESPRFPVQAAANRARPAGGEGPSIALDLTAGDELPSSVMALADLVLRPIPETPGACLLERV